MTIFLWSRNGEEKRTPKWFDAGPSTIGLVCPKGHVSPTPRHLFDRTGKSTRRLACRKDGCRWQDMAKLIAYRP